MAQELADSAVDEPAMRAVRKSESRASRGGGRRFGAPYLLASPFFILFAAFFLVPFVYSIIESTKSPINGAFVGFKNFSYVLGLADFWSGLQRVVYFGVIQVTAMVVLALCLALLLDSPYCRGRRLFSTLYFLPFAVPSVIAALMWGFLYSPDLDGALSLPQNWGLANAPIQPLGNRLVLYAVVLIVLWEFTGYNMTIYLTSLTSISREVLEAAQIDGASQWTVIRRIKLPLIRRTIVFTLVLAIIGTLQLFNEPQILSNLTPYITSSYTPNLSIYSEAFSFGNIPLAAAESLVLAVITILASVTFFRIVSQRGRGPGKRKWHSVGQQPSALGMSAGRGQ